MLVTCIVWLQNISIRPHTYLGDFLGLNFNPWCLMNYTYPLEFSKVFHLNISYPFKIPTLVMLCQNHLQISCTLSLKAQSLGERVFERNQQLSLCKLLYIFCFIEHYRLWNVPFGQSVRSAISDLTYNFQICGMNATFTHFFFYFFFYFSFFY